MASPSLEWQIYIMLGHDCLCFGRAGLIGIALKEVACEDDISGRN
jgi:hypothetical protein